MRKDGLNPAEFKLHHLNSEQKNLCLYCGPRMFKLSKCSLLQDTPVWLCHKLIYLIPIL